MGEKKRSMTRLGNKGPSHKLGLRDKRNITIKKPSRLKKWWSKLRGKSTKIDMDVIDRHTIIHHPFDSDDRDLFHHPFDSVDRDLIHKNPAEQP